MNAEQRISAWGTAESRAAAEHQVKLDVDYAQGIATITLNRPEKHNALTVPMRARLACLLRNVEDDDAVRVIVIRGEGPSLSSGAEINEDWGQRAPGKKRYTLTDATRYGSDMTWGRHGFGQALSRSGKITIVQVHGYCVALSYFTIATKCDLVVAADDARLGALEGRFLGPAGAVSSLHLNRILGLRRARRLGYTADPMSGAEAAQCGLAYVSVPAADLAAETARLARMIAARPADRLAYLKQRITAAESLLGATVPTMTGLLFSHFLRPSEDEQDFWKKVSKGGVRAALADDKAKRAEALANLQVTP